MLTGRASELDRSFSQSHNSSKAGVVDNHISLCERDMYYTLERLACAVWPEEPRLVHGKPEDPFHSIISIWALSASAADAIVEVHENRMCGTYVWQPMSEMFGGPPHGDGVERIAPHNMCRGTQVSYLST